VVHAYGDVAVVRPDRVMDVMGVISIVAILGWVAYGMNFAWRYFR
jgi:hypothetical protein